MIRAALVVLVLAASCRKAPLHDVGARFTLSDATWFEEEHTLFFFYDVRAEQGIGEQTVIEATWLTDDGWRDWVALSDLEPVHTHVAVDCGPNTLCGSASVHVPLEPRNVALRMRYHEDGALGLDAPIVYNVVEEGEPYSHRSLLVYGVFDETNQRVQWRARHQFPTLRNEQVSAYGLRRAFVVSDMSFGTADLGSNRNPYGYGAVCPDSFVATGLPQVTTEERAVFHPDVLPLGAFEAAVVCAQATVTDARNGEFTTGAVAKKNPEVRAAFPELRSPVENATPVKFFLAPCQREISLEHEDMQRQRLEMQNVPTTCIDEWSQPGFAETLLVQMREAVEAERAHGEDMILAIGLHHDDDGVKAVVEDALQELLPDERHRSSPRLAGAVLLDSTIHDQLPEDLRPTMLWCPTDDLGGDASTQACAIAPDNPFLELGPFSFGVLPILPDREQYLDFIDEYSKRAAGKVTSLKYRVPEFAVTSDHVDLGEFGVATFLNGELISADADDAFSHCIGEDPAIVVFRSDGTQRGGARPADCYYAGLPPELCQSSLLTIDLLPDWHNAFREDDYELGLAWDFPFLLRMEYETFTAGNLSAFGFTVPFGFASEEESYYGSETWTVEAIPLSDTLKQCDRFCENPTFDSAGVYHVTDPFRSAYAHNCYTPVYPKPGDSGFPRDP